MAVKIYKATEIEPKNLMWLVYGQSGSGKTAFIGTFPTPIFHINFVQEKGVLTLRGHPGVTVADVERKEDMDEALNYFLVHHAEFKTLAIDSLTTFLDILYAQRTKDGTQKTSFDDWMAWSGQVLGMQARLRKLPVEVVFTATLSGIDNEAGGGSRGAPTLFKSLEKKFPMKMDCNLYMECISTPNGFPTFWGYPSGMGNIPGRIRGIKPLSRIQNPSYGMLLKKMKEGTLFGPSGKAEPPPVDPSTGEAAAQIPTTFATAPATPPAVPPAQPLADKPAVAAAAVAAAGVIAAAVPDVQQHGTPPAQPGT